MRRSWQIRLTWTLAVLYVFVAAMGEGLHLLPGQGHDACCEHGEAGDDDGCASGYCGMGSESPPGVLSSGQLSADPASGVHDHEHCAICQFLAQGTWFAQPVAIPHWQFFRAFRRPAKAICVVCRREHLPFLSRAPPLAADC